MEGMARAASRAADAAEGEICLRISAVSKRHYWVPLPLMGEAAEGAGNVDFAPVIRKKGWGCPYIPGSRNRWNFPYECSLHILPEMSSSSSLQRAWALDPLRAPGYNTPFPPPSFFFFRVRTQFCSLARDWFPFH